MSQPGIGKPIMSLFAVIGHLRRFRTEFPEYES